MKLARLISLALVCLPGWSSAQSNSAQTVTERPIQTNIGGITNLGLGMSLEEVKKRFSVVLKHEFSACIESNQYLCVLLGDYETPAFFYLLFRNQGLCGVLEERPVAFERKSYRGVPWDVPKPVDSEKELQAALKQPFLLAVEIQERIQSSVTAASEASAGSEPENIRPAFKLIEPMLAANRPTVSKARKEAARLIEKYNPFKIKLGMSPAEVHSLLGAPNLSEPNNGQILEVYGTKFPRAASEPVATDDPPLTEANKIFFSVVFQNGQVIRVFSHDFFDTRLEKRETEKSSSKRK